MRCEVFLPTVSTPAKQAKLRSLGAEVVVTGAVYADALQACLQRQQATGALLTHANCFWTNLSFDLATGVRPDDVTLQVLPGRLGSVKVETEPGVRVSADFLDRIVASRTRAVQDLLRTQDPDRIAAVACARGAGGARVAARRVGRGRGARRRGLSGRAGSCC
mgnify:CR=1 FL=1